MWYVPPKLPFPIENVTKSISTQLNQVQLKQFHVFKKTVHV